VGRQRQREYREIGNLFGDFPDPNWWFEWLWSIVSVIPHISDAMQRLRCNVLKRGDDDGITLENMKILIPSELHRCITHPSPDFKLTFCFWSFWNSFSRYKEKVSFGFRLCSCWWLEKSVSVTSALNSLDLDAVLMRGFFVLHRTVPIIRPGKSHEVEDPTILDEQSGIAPPLQPRVSAPATTQSATLSSVRALYSIVSSSSDFVNLNIEFQGKKTGTTVSILVNKIGFKEEMHFVDPRITVSVVCKSIQFFVFLYAS
jgi:hypothetical protein